jgi:TldD protein
MRRALLLLAAVGTAWAGQMAAPAADGVLAAMEAELARSRSLRLADLEPPYFIEYTLDDVSSVALSATLGAIVTRYQSRFRVPRVDVRVGSYEFDNTNYVLTDYFARAAQAAGDAPIDDSPGPLRTYFWLATDAAYKGAVEAIARKRAALRNVGTRDDTPDFSRAEPVQLIEPAAVRAPDEGPWVARVRELSAIFRGYQQIQASQVDYGGSLTVTRLVNTEGTRIRYPDRLAWIRFRADSQAPDGMAVRDAATLAWQDLDREPGALELRRTAMAVAENVLALVKAPAGESYTGPVLLEGIAAPQLLAQLLGGNLAPARRPVAEAGRTPPIEPSEFEDRLGARILPEWIDVVDDPTQTEWRGRRLLGHYRVDMEGVIPVPLTLVERGVLKGFLLTRRPVKAASASNGRARLPGVFGANTAAISNLFVSASRTETAAALRAKLIELCRQRGKSYGIVIRKLDFPSSADGGELRRIAAGARQRGSGRLLSRPLLVYRVWADGREELVRGLEFRSLSARLLRDIVAASDENHLFEYLANTAPLSLAGAGGYVAGCSVVAPSLLVEEMELEAVRDSYPRPPLVPAPAISIAR